MPGRSIAIDASKNEPTISSAVAEKSNPSAPWRFCSRLSPLRTPSTRYPPSSSTIEKDSNSPSSPLKSESTRLCSAATSENAAVARNPLNSPCVHSSEVQPGGTSAVIAAKGSGAPEEAIMSCNSWSKPTIITASPEPSAFSSKPCSTFTLHALISRTINAMSTIRRMGDSPQSLAKGFGANPRRLEGDRYGIINCALSARNMVEKALFSSVWCGWAGGR